MILAAPAPEVVDITEADLDNTVLIVSLGLCRNQISGFIDAVTIREMKEYDTFIENEDSFESVARGHCHFMGLDESEYLEVFADQKTARRRLDELIDQSNACHSEGQREGLIADLTIALLRQFINRLPEKVDYAV